MLAWSELNRLVFDHYSPEVIGQLAQILRRHHYERIARIPAQADVLSGLPREPLLLLNSLWGSTYRLFSPSALPAIHRFILAKQDRALSYLLSVLFFNERTALTELRQYFPAS